MVYRHRPSGARFREIAQVRRGADAPTSPASAPAQTLQTVLIAIHCGAMSSSAHRPPVHRPLLRALPLLAGILLGLATALPAQADDQAIRNEQAGFLERYTNTAQELILKGLEMVGVSYRRGGTDPDSGLDCSGFVQLVYRESIGKVLPRTSREMSEVGERVDRKELQPGDLVFFNTMRRAFSHVGIYLGEGRFLHAPRPGGEVRVEEMGSSYWVKRYNGARRILER